MFRLFLFRGEIVSICFDVSPSVSIMFRLSLLCFYCFYRVSFLNKMFLSCIQFNALKSRLHLSPDSVPYLSLASSQLSPMSVTKIL
jgi:hypothetical protein